LFPSPPKDEKKGGANQTTYLKKLKMFARFRNLFAKSKGDEEVEHEVTPRLEVPSIVVDEPPNEVEPPVEESENKSPNGDHNLTNTSAPLASEEEDLAGNPHEILSDSSSDLSRLLEAIDEASKLPASPPKDEKKGGANQTTYLKKLKMFARFRNLFAKSKGDEEVEHEVTPRLEVPSIVVDEPPNEVEPPVEESENKSPNGDHNLTNTSAPLASEEEIWREIPMRS